MQIEATVPPKSCQDDFLNKKGNKPDKTSDSKGSQFYDPLKDQENLDPNFTGQIVPIYNQ